MTIVVASDRDGVLVHLLQAHVDELGLVGEMFWVEFSVDKPDTCLNYACYYSGDAPNNLYKTCVDTV